MKSRLGLTVAAMLCVAAPANADTFTYTYTAPLLFSSDPGGNNSTLTIEFTTVAPLAPSTVYTALPGDTLSSSFTVSSAYSLGNYTMPMQTFEVNTDSAGTIAAWYIFSEVRSTLVGIPPTMTGRDIQAYTINSLSTAVPMPQPLTQSLAYDQATIVDFYASCVGVPGCTLAGDGQPYVYRFDAITPNPDSLGSWTVTDVPDPSAVPLHPLPLLGQMLLLALGGFGLLAYRRRGKALQLG
jgi:hypothetical protein